MNEFIKASPKIFLYSAIVLYLVGGIIMMMNFMMNSGTGEIEIDTERINEVVTRFRGGLMASYPSWWIVSVTIMAIVASILGYYAGISSGCMISLPLLALPMLLWVGFLVCGSLGFFVVAVVMVIAFFVGLFETGGI